MRKLICALLILFFCLTLNCTFSIASTITNGNFQTGDFTGWTTDTDGLPGYSSDFFVVDDGSGDYHARIEVDYFTNAAWYANTVFQAIDTTVSDNHSLQLSFSWEFGGEDGDTINDFMVVGLNDGAGNLYGADGNIGSLLSTDVYGGGVFNATLDYDTFANTSWFLDFQLNVGGDYDYKGSYLLVDNVSLEVVSNTSAAPEPNTCVLLSLGLLTLTGLARIKRKV